MTIGVGGSTAKIELEKLANMTNQVKAISEAEFKQRIKKAQAIMAENNIAATLSLIHISEPTRPY